MRTALLIFLIMVVMIGIAAALPTNGASTGTSEQINLSSTGNTGSDCWFTYNTQTTGYMVRTQNFTPTSGGCFGTIKGALIWACQTYYWHGCDQTGCSAAYNQVQTTAIIPVAVPTLGGGLRNFTEQNYNILAIPGLAFSSYTWIVTATDSSQLVWAMDLIIALVVFGVYMASGFRTRGVLMPLILIAISAGVFFASGGVFGYTIPSEFVQIIYSIVVGAMAGVIVSWFK